MMSVFSAIGTPDYARSGLFGLARKSMMETVPAFIEQLILNYNNGDLDTQPTFGFYFQGRASTITFGKQDLLAYAKNSTDEVFWANL